MHKRSPIELTLIAFTLFMNCVPLNGQQSTTPGPTHKDEATKKSLLAVQHDAVKSTALCFSKFDKWTNQLHLSEFNTDYGTERALRDQLDKLRDEIALQTVAISDGTDDSLIDPLIALEMLKTVHEASVSALLFSVMQVNLPNKQIASGLADTSRSCSAAHESLASYLAVSIALK